MPVKWTSDLDLLLIRGILDKFNVTISKDLCHSLADQVNATGQVNNECSWKAVDTRIREKLWEKKKSAGQATGTKTPSKATPKASGVRKTASAKSSAKKKTAPIESESDAELQGTLDPDSPSVNRKKRARAGTRKSYAESHDSEDTEDYLPLRKHVKTEPKDDDDMSAALHDQAVADATQEV